MGERKRLDEIVYELISSGEKTAVRLLRGLVLGLTTSNGFNVLGCSRVDVAPSDTDMVVLKTAVVAVFDPRWLFESDRADLINGTNGQVHYIRRLYWPLEDIKAQLEELREWMNKDAASIEQKLLADNTELRTELERVNTIAEDGIAVLNAISEERRPGRADA